MRTFIFAAIAALFSGSAMADPNIDMSELRMNGQFNIDITSTSVAGALIQGTRPGTISATTSASNIAGGFGGFGGDIEMDTDNFGPGVSGDFNGGAMGGFVTYTDGQAWANTTGVGNIETTAGSFGSATMGWSGTIDTTLRSDDWN